MKLRHFSIRDLLWLTLVAALVTAWWIDRSELNDRLESYRKRQTQPGYAAFPPPDPQRGTIRAARIDHAESRRRIQQTLAPDYRNDHQFPEE